jgi:hypothetical protein
MGFLGELSNFQLFKNPVHWCIYEMSGGSKIVWVKNISFVFFLVIFVVNSLIYDNITFFSTKTPYIGIKADLIKCQVTTGGTFNFQYTT